MPHRVGHRLDLMIDLVILVLLHLQHSQDAAVRILTIEGGPCRGTRGPRPHRRPARAHARDDARAHASCDEWELSFPINFD